MLSIYYYNTILFFCQYIRKIPLFYVLFFQKSRKETSIGDDLRIFCLKMNELKKILHSEKKYYHFLLTRKKVCDIIKR